MYKIPIFYVACYKVNKLKKLDVMAEKRQKKIIKLLIFDEFYVKMSVTE